MAFERASTVLVAVFALAGVSAVHEAGHVLAVWLKGGRVLRVQLGRGPVLWRWSGAATDFVVSVIPVGGRVHYDGIRRGSSEAVVAVGGAAANLALSVLAFATAAWLLRHAGPPGSAGTGALAYATAHAGAWFWAVPGALVEVITTGGALELRRALATVMALVAARPAQALPYAVGALSALWAALNLIPLPVVETDGWHVARAVWRSRRT
jgi:membrane-associated protease RseP (regulator of RpoE activity)